jgi:phosphomevalonate kinase
VSVITSRAPGKLFIAGEYAVVEPGHPSVIVAVDRYVTVQLSPAEGAGSISSDQYGKLPVVWRRQGDAMVLDQDHRPFDYVLTVIKTVERFAAERGVPLGFFDLAITSELDDVNGRKFGLGSSAAVTVATVRVLDEFYGLRLGPLEQFKLALLATVQVAPKASGGDVAASLFGGWITYSAPDRDALRARLDAGARVSDLVAEEWPLLDVRNLQAPSSLELLVGWTGEPASTTKLVDELQGRKQREESHYAEFLEGSRRCVDELVAALARDDAETVKARIREARDLLGSLSAGAGVHIETPELSALIAAAESIGAAAKSSGAGGGDCGIVLADAGAPIGEMVRRWEQRDIRRLALAVHPPLPTEITGAIPTVRAH